MTRVLILKENHGLKVFDVSNMEQLHATSLLIVKGRFENYYYPNPKEPEKPEFTASQVKRLPFLALREHGRKILSDYNELQKKYEQDKIFYDSVVKCIESNDGESAFSILTERKKKEGEGFDVSEVQTTY